MWKRGTHEAGNEQTRGFISVLPLIGCVSLGNPFNLPIHYLSNTMTGQDVGPFPVLKVII